MHDHSKTALIDKRRPLSACCTVTDVDYLSLSVCQKNWIKFSVIFVSFAVCWLHIVCYHVWWVVLKNSCLNFVTNNDENINVTTDVKFKMVYPMLSDHCLSCPVCDVGVLWPNSWMDEDATWYVGRPQPRPYCVRWGHSSPLPKRGTAASPLFAHVCCGHTVAHLSNCWACFIISDKLCLKLYLLKCEFLQQIITLKAQYSVNFVVCAIKPKRLDVV